MPSPVDQRLASLIHQREIRALGRIDRLTAQIGASYDRIGRALLRIVAVPEADYASQLDRTIADGFKAIRTETRSAFEAEIRTAHRETADAMIRAIPARWFRLVHPMVFEAEGNGNGYWLDLDDDEKRAILDELVFPSPDDATVTAYLEKGGPGSLTWDERLESWEGPVRAKMRAQLIAGVSAGEMVPDLRKRLEPLVGDIRYKAQRIARTEGRRVGERAQMAAYEQAGDLLDGMQIIATLDANTRAEHAARHGKVFPQQPDGGYVAADGQPLPDLPDEANCRCYPSPILRTPKEIEVDPLVRAQFESASADVIPDPGVYSRWWAVASDEEKKRAVGVRRYNAVVGRVASRGRAPEWEDFLDRDGKLMPVEKLKRQTFAAWDRRRVAVEDLIAKRERIMRQVAATGFDLSDLKPSRRAATSKRS